MTAVDEHFQWQPKRTDLSYRATFAAPQFGLLTAAARSFYSLHSRLSRFGLRLSDIKVEGNATSPAEFAIVCSFPASNAVLRLRLESLEFNAYLPTTGDATLQQIVAEAIEALKEITAPLYKAILIHQATFEIHGTLTDVAPRDYLLRYVSRLPWEESQREGVNLAFNIGADTDSGRFSAAVVVAKSGVIADGLYVQITAGYDGALPLNDFASRYAKLVVDSFTRLQLREESK